MDHLKHLILAFLRSEITPSEQAELDTWLAQAPANRALLEELQDQGTVAEALAKLDGLHRVEAWQKVSNHAAAVRIVNQQLTQEVTHLEEQSRPRRIGIRWMAAASLALLGTGTWWMLQNRTPTQAPAGAVSVVKTTDVAAPSRSRATLTLASGQTVYLDSAASGALAQQGGARIVKGSGSQLSYQMTLNQPGELLYNTLNNPRGSQVIHLTLSDGSRVWLNAESSIKYPAVFGSGDRTVDMTGEAYFEVAADAHRPFRVKQEETTIDVLGTSFNVSAYPDDPSQRVTLLEGAVRVAVVALPGSGVNSNTDKLSFVLKACQQAQVVGLKTNNGNEIRVLKSVDTAAVMAWKNGLFAFHGADLQTVLRELARWYDVAVRFEGAIPERTFGGEIGKTLTLQQVLKVLTGQHIHYTIQDKILTIRP